MTEEYKRMTQAQLERARRIVGQVALDHVSDLEGAPIDSLARLAQRKCKRAGIEISIKQVMEILG